MNARDDEAKEGSLGTGKYIFEAATVLFVTVTDIGFIVTCSYLILTSVKAATCSVRVHRELTWQPDDASGECAECAMPFNFLRRRHHCRGCGRLLCGDCSSYKATLLHRSRHARILTPCLAPKAPMPAGAVIEGKPVATQMQRACARCISTRFSLYGAAQAGDAASVKRLVEVQGGLAKCDNSALEQAVISGELQAVQVLVQVGVALNRGNREGVTCLMQAAYCGHEEILKVLVEAGADVDKKDDYGRDALDHAAKGGHVSAFCQVLREASLPGEAQMLDTQARGPGGVKLRDMVQWG